MTKSGDKKLYFLTLFLISFIIHAIVILVSVGIMYAFGMRIDAIGYIAFLFCVANPLWICSIATFLGLIRRKKAITVTGVLVGIFAIFLFIQNTTASFWYSPTTY